MLPLRQFVIKLHERCNLACDYCYVYQMADQRWRERPVRMPPDVVRATAARIAEHAHTHQLDRVDVVVHGGEPLLAGPDAIAHLVHAVRSALGDGTVARFTVQTNGTLLDRDLLGRLAELDVRVSVSLDGDRRAHDRHRTGRHGAGSYDRAVAGVRLLGSAEFRPWFAGLLCVVDLANDPLRTYLSLLELAPPTLDFLLPHGNWTSTPPGRSPDTLDTPYGDWLIAVFDRWFGAPERECGIRLFDELIHVLFGGQSGVEGVGLSPALLAVVETDGTIEQSDDLNSTFPGAARTGLHVRDDPFDRVLARPDVLARQSGAAGLPGPCRLCDLRVVCGGGLRAHRFRAGAGFDHPSVFCPDLDRLIRHIRQALANGLATLR